MSKKANKKKNFLYGLDAIPPFSILLILGFQHVIVTTSTLIFPVIVSQQCGMSFNSTRDFVSLTIIATGIGTILQGLKKSEVGSGYLVPSLCEPSYMNVTLHSGWIGGFPLISGMTIIAGFFEALISRVIHRVSFFFPKEIAGLAVFMIGVSLIPLGTSKFTGIEYAGDSISLTYFIVSFITLSVIVVLNLIGKGILKLYCVIIGIGIGFFLSYVAGIIDPSAIDRIISAEIFKIPIGNFSKFEFAFEWNMVIPFLIISLCASLKSVGNITNAQKINNCKWEAPDTKNLSRGLFSDSLSVIIAGFIGGMAPGTSASNVATSQATGATSRVISYPTGILLILFGFSPKIGTIFTLMPGPVMGAILVFVASFMLISGMQIMRPKDFKLRETYVIGISFLFGISVDIMPGMYSSINHVFQPFFSSSLTLTIMLAIILNAVTKISPLHK